MHMNFIEFSSATFQPPSSKLLSSRNDYLSSSGNVTSEASFCVRPQLPKPQAFKFMKQRKASYPALTELRNREKARFLEIETPLTTWKATDPQSPTRTSSHASSPRPFKHFQDARLPKPAGDPGEANFTVGSRSIGNKSVYRNSVHEKSSSMLWSFAQQMPSFFKSRVESRSHLHLNAPDSSRIVREGGTENDQGMPIDTIVDCEELLLQNEQFMRYYMLKEEEQKKRQRKASQENNFLRLPFVPAVPK